MADADSEVDIDVDDDRDISPRTSIATATVTGLIVAIIVAWLFRPAARLDFFFDEMWRVDQIRSANPIESYLDGPAPIPPGWITGLWAWFQVVPSRRPLIRASAAVWAIPASIFLALTLRTMLRRTTGGAVLVIWATCAAVLTVVTAGIAAHMVYFNNYLADLAVATALLFVLVLIDVERSRSVVVWSSAVALAAVAPWLGQGALLLLPGACAVVYLRRRSRPGLALAGALALATSCGVVAWFFVRPVAENGTIEDFWEADTPSIGAAEFARRFASSFVDSAYPEWVRTNEVYVAAGLALTVVGLVVLQRAWRWWLPLYGSAQLFALGAALTVGWPATFVRVNTSFQVLVYAGAPVGISYGLFLFGRRLQSSGRSKVLPILVTVALSVATLAAWWPKGIANNSASTAVFARGLSNDLQLIAADAKAGDLVVAYHLSGPYVRDAILNGGGVAAGVTIADEARDPRVVDGLDELAKTVTTSIWCVLPYEAGPEASDAACRPDPTMWAETMRTSLSRATIVHLERIDTVEPG